MSRNEKLNSLVTQFKTNGSEEVFADIYATVSQDWRQLHTVAKSVRADVHEITALYEDVLLKCIDRYDGSSDFSNFYKYSVTRARTDLYRKKSTLTKHETLYEQSEDSEAATFELADDFNLEDSIIAKKKADQRQLIDSLLSDADESTTAIVETFLSHPKPTATAIARELGVHHSKVTRALNRLAAKFDPKQYGEHTDYLVAL